MINPLYPAQLRDVMHEVAAQIHATPALTVLHLQL